MTTDELRGMALTAYSTVTRDAYLWAADEIDRLQRENQAHANDAITAAQENRLAGERITHLERENGELSEARVLADTEAARLWAELNRVAPFLAVHSVFGYCIERALSDSTDTAEAREGR